MSALNVACILEQAHYKPGDQAPEGYLAWHEWAEVQHKAGLRQKQCGRCGLWRYPQQLSATIDRVELTGLRLITQAIGAPVDPAEPDGSVPAASAAR